MAQGSGFLVKYVCYVVSCLSVTLFHSCRLTLCYWDYCADQHNVNKWTSINATDTTTSINSAPSSSRDSTWIFKLLTSITLILVGLFLYDSTTQWHRSSAKPAKSWSHHPLSIYVLMKLGTTGQLHLAIKRQRLSIEQ